MIRAVALALCLTAAPLAADPLVESYGDVLRSCYGDRGSSLAREACVGAMTEACLAGEPDGQTTVGMMQCVLAEHVVWDGYLNAEYRATMGWARAADQAEGEDLPEFARRAEALRAAQRAWIAFRDTECGLAYAVWGAGSMRQIAGADCLMEMTARRALDLTNLREMME
ncbi:MAG: lysozyme inhibitor LprI family protein [Pseudomonadota bacterium]